MNDPYSILGVSPTATDEEVKNAYHTMARKYHPDRYAGSDLADLANEKMQQVNAAYSQICEMRKNGGRGTGASYYGSSTGGYSSDGQSRTTYGSASSPRYAEVRQDLSLKRFAEAADILRNVDPANRGAEWHFLMGVLSYNTGNRVDAQQYASDACRMAPDNPEYRRFLNVTTGRNPGGNDQSWEENSGCSVSDICTALLCMNCCCGNSYYRC